MLKKNGRKIFTKLAS